MPRNQFQRIFFAFVTVVITVHAYVFFSLYVVNGSALMELNGTSSVLDAIRHQNGVYMFGRYLPIWSVVCIEFVFAFCLELLMGSPCSFKLASRIFDPRRNHPMLFESAIICATVGLMCPAMSFIASFLYYPYYEGFQLVHLLASWLKLMCFNFPFAFFTQMFFIQPFVRTVFKAVFHKDIEAQVRKAKEHEQLHGEKFKVKSETESIAAIMKRIEEIKEDLQNELAQIQQSDSK